MFLYHHHNLEHEDMGMMRSYFVESPDAVSAGHSSFSDLESQAFSWRYKPYAARPGPGVAD